MSRPSNALRDALITEFRKRICETCAIIPFVHQASWWAASDGAVLLDVESPDGMTVRFPDESIKTMALAPRPGGRARVIADLGAYKVGKSYGTAVWISAFACIPGARVQLIGLEYDICEPEFQYLCDILLSDRGMGIEYESLQNRPRDGRMWLELKNGARFEAKSWERKDSLKGKEVDVLAFSEAYMLPGIECYTSFSQNLRARDGYAIFATTPDRPWVKELHEAAHSGLPDFQAWHCTCGVHSSANPFTFNQTAMDRDRTLMTREKFAIHYLGQLGDFVGRVYNYQRGQRLFGQTTLGDGTREGLTIPENWELVAGCDTGTFHSALLVAFSPDGVAYVIDEFPNYRYVAGEIERDEQVTIPIWATMVANRLLALGGRPHLWADTNSQYKGELRAYGLSVLGNTVPLEARTSTACEYFVQDKIFLAPWLQILPFELENAAWPEETTMAGKFTRLKKRDHTLDCLEHVLSKRPRGHVPPPVKRPATWLESYAGNPAPLLGKRYNIHIGKG